MSKPSKNTRKCRKPAPKSTKVTILKRIDKINTMMLSGASRGKIVQYGTKTWGCKSRNIDKYISTVRKMWEKEVSLNVAQNLHEAIQLRRDLYDKAVKAKQYHTALSIEQDIRKLLGVYSPEVIKVLTNQDDEEIKEFSNQELINIALGAK